MSPFLPTPLENVQGESYCVLRQQKTRQVYESQRSDKTADYCSKNIFLDEASLLENNNQDNGHLLCCVTPLKLFKKRERKKEEVMHSMWQCFVSAPSNRFARWLQTRHGGEKNTGMYCPAVTVQWPFCAVVQHTARCPPFEDDYEDSSTTGL